MIASEDELLTYLADLIIEIERFAVTVLPPNDGDEVALGRQDDGSLVVDLECRPPLARRSADVAMEIYERWTPDGRGRYERADYAFELRHGELGYRRAFHRHGAEHFLRAHQVATHEHCEEAMGNVVCEHYFGEPVGDAFDGFNRLYDLWLSGDRPDCPALRCLG